MYNRIIGRLHIFQVSDGGVYSRTLAELEAYNMLEKIVKANPDIWYVIPPEDPCVAAIVSVEGQSKSLILAFRSQVNQVFAYDAGQYVLGVADDPGRLTADNIREALK